MHNQMRSGIADLLQRPIGALVISTLLVLHGCIDPEPSDTTQSGSGTTQTMETTDPSESVPAEMPAPPIEPAKEPEPLPERGTEDTEDVVDEADAAPGARTFSIPDETRARLAVPIEKVTLDGVMPLDADAALDKFDMENLGDTFDAVASGIAFEPYSGVLRGAEGTALAGSGNAIDQALLLASALDGHVNAWRIAEGRLDDEALSTLLATVGQAYDGDHAFTSDDPELYDPTNEPHFREAAKVHYWLEVQKETSDPWLALDPSYPNANVGQSFATATRRLDIPDVLMMQRLEVRFMQENASGKVQLLGAISGDVADLALYPIVLVTRAIPQYGAEQQEPEGDIGETTGGLLGGRGLLGGDSDEDQDTAAAEPVTDAVTTRAIIGTEYRRELIYGGNEPKTLTATLVTDAEPESRIMREWIEFILKRPGAANREIVRDLYHASSDSDAPATVRRYSIAVVTGRVSREMLEGYRDKLDLDQINDARQKLAALQTQPATNELALEIMKLESASALTPHLMNLAFAYESDELTERLASGAAINVIRDTPRILITAIETGVTAGSPVDTRTTLDLRLDEVRAAPYKGIPVGTARLFQRARGMQESALEGRVLTRFADEPDDVVTTTRIMHDAQSQDNQLVLLSKDDRSVQQELTGLPDRVVSRIETALDAGHEIILPSGAATITGEDHWGWWDVNPATGAFVGVMDGGQHQAMAHYTVTLEEVGINDAMAHVIGGITESAATMASHSARMLQYGQVTERLTQEVAAVIKSLTCVTCPDFEVEPAALSAQASFSSACFEQTGRAIAVEDSVSGSVSFCEKYKLGISCSASLILGAYEAAADTGIGPDFSLDLEPLNCD